MRIHPYKKRHGHKEESIVIAYLALDVVEGEHAVGISTLSLDCGGTLARPGRTESGTHNADRSAKASCRSSRDAVPIPGIHELILQNAHYFPVSLLTKLCLVPKFPSGFTFGHVTFFFFFFLRVACIYSSSFSTFSPTMYNVLDAPRRR